MVPGQMYSRPGALPKEPTDAPPGSEAKILIMMERAARREQLFHPLDGPGRRSTLPPEARRWPLPTCEPLEMELIDLDDEEDFAGDEEETFPLPADESQQPEPSSISFSA